MKRLRRLVTSTSAVLSVAALLVVGCSQGSSTALSRTDGPSDRQVDEDQPPVEPSPEPPEVRPEPPLPPGRHAVVVHDCDVEGGYSVVESRDASASSDRTMDVHAIEVYQTRDDHSHDFHPTGAADIYVHAASRPQVLVLTAYEPTLWRVHADDGAVIPLVVLDGYHPQEVTGVPSDIEVVTRGNWAAVPDQELAQLADAAFTSETYCYDASLFSIRPA